MKKAFKVLLSFDSFKDSLEARAVGEAVSEGLKQVFDKTHNLSFVNIPLSDGGEGFVNSLQPVLDEKELDVCYHEITGPFPGEKHRCKYLVYRKEMAIMDLASTSGLEMVPTEKRDPYKTTTYGLGELIKHVHYQQKIKKVLLGVGGSSTNDAGFGALQALGLKFLPPDLYPNKEVLVGQDLLKIESFQSTEEKFTKLVPDLNVDIACDVENLFSGEFGAAMVYGKQKGMTPEQQKEMDLAMQRLEKEMMKFTGRDISVVKGTGAAGGISGGFVAFQDAKLRPGIELFCEYVQLEEHVKECDVVFSGEGKYDQQTINHGKTVSFVEYLSKKHGKPMVVVCGKNEVVGKDNVFELMSMYEFEESMKNTIECLKNLIVKNSKKFPGFSTE